jgi:hypothetical protein
MRVKELDKNTVGLIVGAFAGLIHLLWVVLVAVGVAQAFLDWIYGLHFLSNPFRVAAFNLGTAVILVLVTFVLGYIFGWIFTAIWNTLKGKK